MGSQKSTARDLPVQAQLQKPLRPPLHVRQPRLEDVHLRFEGVVVGCEQSAELIPHGFQVLVTHPERRPASRTRKQWARPVQ